jgi:hypothetical protein
LVVVGVMAGVFAFVFFGRVVAYFSSSVVCFESDAKGNYVQGECPPTVIPPQESDSGLVRVEVANADPGWIEGGYFYMRATSPDDQVVLEQPLEFQFGEWESPAASGEVRPPPTASGEAYLAPGSYELTIYGRNCNGNCGQLSPPSLECTLPITVTANDQLTIEYDWSVPSCTEAS